MKPDTGAAYTNAVGPNLNRIGGYGKLTFQTHISQIVDSVTSIRINHSHNICIIDSITRALFSAHAASEEISGVRKPAKQGDGGWEKTFAPTSEQNCNVKEFNFHTCQNQHGRHGKLTA